MRRLLDMDHPIDGLVCNSDIMAFGAILASPEARGYLDNVVVFLTSDHGDCLGEHGLVQKWANYDCVTRTPLIAWSPKRLAGGQTVDGLCQLFDLGPTILELAGLTVSSALEASSLLPVLDPKP